MAQRSKLIRSAVRRSGGTSINGLTGALTLASPMLTTSGSTFRIDNANPTTLTDAATITGIDASLNTAFNVTIEGNRTMDKPTNARDAEKIIFQIEQGPLGPFTLTFDPGANGYRFANAASPQGPKLTDWNTLLAATPIGSYSRIGFIFDEADGFWDAVAIAGFWP